MIRASLLVACIALAAVAACQDPAPPWLTMPTPDEHAARSFPATPGRRTNSAAATIATPTSPRSGSSTASTATPARTRARRRWRRATWTWRTSPGRATPAIAATRTALE